MNIALRSLNLIRASNVSYPAMFSTSACMCDYKDFRRRWTSPKKWKKNRFTGEAWAPGVPMEQNNNPWSHENAYFGTYDFMDILGNDLTMDPKLLCKGPSYLRGQRLLELQMLLKRRKQYGARMHAEDLNQTDKRIKWLLKVHNHKKRKTHG